MAYNVFILDGNFDSHVSSAPPVPPRNSKIDGKTAINTSGHSSTAVELSAALISEGMLSQ
jgi:hypothetical protein